ncbi:MAG: hypothetical protein EZS28_037196, partial [Streblomastix strix]
MCFGVKHAPLTFHKTLRPVIKLIIEVLRVRIVAYCDDIIIIYEERMGNQHGEGPINDDRRTISQNEGTERKMEQNNTIREDCEGKVSSQLPQISQLSTLTDQERRPFHVKTEQNQIINSNVQRMEQLLVSSTQYTAGNILVEVPNRQEQTQPSNYSTATSDPINRCINEQLRCMPEASESRRIDTLSGRLGQVRSLKIETDNSSAEFNINRGAAAAALAKLVDRTLETAEKLNIQLYAFRIPGLQNKILDSLSRLSTSGDYTIGQEILNEALHILKVRPTIDMFANCKNRRCRRFVNLVRDNWAVAQDSLSVSWKGEVPYLQPPIPLIQAMLNKLDKENVSAVMVIPNWPSQAWRPIMMNK